MKVCLWGCVVVVSQGKLIPGLLEAAHGVCMNLVFLGVMYGFFEHQIFGCGEKGCGGSPIMCWGT